MLDIHKAKTTAVLAALAMLLAGLAGCAPDSSGNGNPSESGGAPVQSGSDDGNGNSSPSGQPSPNSDSNGVRYNERILVRSYSDNPAVSDKTMVLSSRDELDAVLSGFAPGSTYYNVAGDDEGTDSASEAFSRFDDAFFEDSCLVCAEGLISSASHHITHEEVFGHYPDYKLEIDVEDSGKMGVQVISYDTIFLPAPKD